MQNKETYNIIDKISPLITEKSLKISEHGFVAFKAPIYITKKQIEKAITLLYKDAKIIKISSLLVKGKKKRFKGKIGKRSDFKKFNIKLEKPIDITTGIK
ncbi:MAG: 50S ribosomal protein L23 [Rickettsiales bacterium]|nr:50S ribosomal protein L23 [Rickettsiales bacterium]